MGRSRDRTRGSRFERLPGSGAPQRTQPPARYDQHRRPGRGSDPGPRAPDTGRIRRNSAVLGVCEPPRKRRTGSTWARFFCRSGSQFQVPHWGPAAFQLKRRPPKQKILGLGPWVRQRLSDGAGPFGFEGLPGWQKLAYRGSGVRVSVNFPPLRGAFQGGGGGMCPRRGGGESR